MTTNDQADQESIPEGIGLRRERVLRILEDAYQRAENTPEVKLCRAVEYGRFEELKQLIENGGDPNTRDHVYNSSLLHAAVFCGRLDVVKYLVEKGADIVGQDDEGDTPVHEAAFWGQLPILKYFLEEKNIDMNNLYNKYGQTPLHRALECDSDDFTRAELLRKLDMIRYLIESKHVDVNEKGPRDRCPLHYAVQYDFLDMIKYLVEKGADIHAQDQNGITPLQMAIKLLHVPAVTYFVEEKNADVNKRNDQGNTPLHMAAISRSSRYGGRCTQLESFQTAIIKCLIESKRADINAKGSNGNTPLHWAAERGTLNTIEYLVEKGADVNGENDEGDTPLKIAAKRKRQDVVKFITSLNKATLCKKRTIKRCCRIS